VKSFLVYEKRLECLTSPLKFGILILEASDFKTPSLFTNVRLGIMAKNVNIKANIKELSK